jgi:large subunit ribosomal protein L6
MVCGGEGPGPASATLEVQGPKASSDPVPPGISFSLEGAELTCKRENDERQQRAFHGMARALAQNAVKGVTDGSPRSSTSWASATRPRWKAPRWCLLSATRTRWSSRSPRGIKIAVDKQTHIVVSGIDRQKVGQVAAEIRQLRKPDPYKQKGIRYVGEILKKKAGKAGATGGAK